MNKQIVIPSILAAILLIWGVTALMGDKDDGRPVRQPSNSGVGAVSSPDISSRYLSVNDVRREYNRQSLKTASTTVCAIRSPRYATSTLVVGGIKWTVGTTSAMFTEIGKSATAFATTTSLGTANLTANTQGTMLATTAVGGSFDEAMVFPPNNWMVVKVDIGAATDVTNFAPTGICQATFEQI